MDEVRPVGGGKGFVTKASDFDTYRGSIAPVLRNGTPRSQLSAGFQATVRERDAHIDVITAEDSAAGQGVYVDMVQWMDAAVRLAPR